jgi:hypothetical protein
LKHTEQILELGEHAPDPVVLAVERFHARWQRGDARPLALKYCRSEEQTISAPLSCCHSASSEFDSNNPVRGHNHQKPMLATNAAAKASRVISKPSWRRA